MLKKRLLSFVIMGVLICGTACFIAQKAYAAPNTYYVNPDTGNDLWDGTTSTFISGTTGPVQTIDQAITLASSGDTIILAPASFIGIGDVTINKSVTIRSFAGTFDTPKKTVIQGDGDLIIDADDVSIVGINFDGITALNPPVLINAHSDDTVRDCKFSHSANSNAIQAAGTTNLLISNNVFSEIEAIMMATGVYLSSTSNTQILENSFINSQETGIWDDNSANLEIHDNAFYHIAATGIRLDSTDNANIEGNTLINCNYSDGSSAINLYASSLTGTINITSNIINDTYRAGSGTAIGTDGTDVAGATVNINNNDLSSNVWGVDYPGIGAINAEDNWWGSSTGPYEFTRNPHGLGSSITNNNVISFLPYKTYNYWVKNYTVTGNISMAVFKDKLFQARRDKYNHLYTRYSANGDSWTVWTYGGHAYSDIAMAVNGSALYQAIKGTGGYFYRRYTTNGTTWSSWAKSGTTIGKINMWSYSGNLYQTKIVSGNKAYMRINNGSWSYLGTSLSNIESVNLAPGIIQSRIASNKYIYYRTAVDGVTWSPWVKEGGTAKNLTMAVFDDGGGDSIYETKVGLDNYFYSRVFAAAWVRSGSASGKPSMVGLDEKLYQSKRVGTTTYIRSSLDGTTWDGWQVDHTASGDEALTGFSGELYRALRGTNGYLYTTHM